MRTTVALGILLLACIAVCTSSSFPGCRCLGTVEGVNPSNVVDVVEYGPRPYCRRQEVIVILKNKRSRCLDPNGQFAQKLLQTKRRHMEERAAQLKSSRSAKTSAARGSAAPPTQVL